MLGAIAVWPWRLIMRVAMDLPAFDLTVDGPPHRARTCGQLLRRMGDSEAPWAGVWRLQAWALTWGMRLRFLVFRNIFVPSGIGVLMSGLNL